MSITRPFVSSKRLACIFSLAMCAGLLFSGFTGYSQPAQASPSITLTNALQARRFASSQNSSNCTISLEGVVIWVNSSRDQLILQDDSGGIAINTDLPKNRSIREGTRVSITGLCHPDHGGITSEAIVDNNGTHSSAEKSMRIYLSAGLHPISVQWFNGLARYELAVRWMGPRIPRSPIPSGALFRNKTNQTGTNDLMPGLNYQCYQGSWDRLPDFSRLLPVKQGVATNFDLGVRTRDENVALTFDGYLSVPRTGTYTFWTRSDDGSKLSLEDLLLCTTALGPSPLPPPRLILPGATIREEEECQRAQLEGTVTEVTKLPEGWSIEVTSSTGRTYLKLLEAERESLKALLHARVKATGICQTSFTVGGQPSPFLLVPDPEEIEILDIDPARSSRKISENTEKGLPLLTEAIQVMNLSRSEALRGYPVRIRGVITAQAGNDFFFQDSTWSVYIAWNGTEAREVPNIGEYWEIEGKTSAHFAPDVQVSRATYLRAGELPKPIHPTWDELVNGSLATKYVEIQGIVTAAQANELTLLTGEGKLKLLLRDPYPDPQSLKKLEDALIRIRGVGSPERDTNQMMLKRLLLFSPTINVDEPAPPRPFDAPLKRAADFLFFDTHANGLRRVKIAGQVLQKRRGIYFLRDGEAGLRFEPKTTANLQTGDLVEVVGFPDMSGPSPLLREAQVRMTGKTNLPPSKPLHEQELLNGKLDTALVGVEARLIDMGMERAEQVLELQAGNRNFVARLPIRSGVLPKILPGSLLHVTGVYAGQGGDRASGRDIDSFELLLTAPSDIRVLAQPSWWTVRHTFAVLGAMVFVIAAGMVWITQLRRKVEQRSMQLAFEIRNREQAERQSALEKERARIAQDLHDELGAMLTEVRFLSAVESRDSSLPEPIRAQLTEVSSKSGQMVSALDEIVWAVNPANDTLPSLANYLCHATEEFFLPTQVRCRLDVGEHLPNVSLTAETRHNLYLVIREAMNNIAKHSRASEACLRIHWKDKTLSITVEDNGCGFVNDTIPASRNGLSNMRARIEKLGGRFECDSRPGCGTICRIFLS